MHMRGARTGIRSLRRQSGISLMGRLSIAIMVGFFVYCAVRIVPGYIAYLTIRDIVIRVAEEYDEDEDTIADVRASLAGYFNLNQVKAITLDEIEVTRKEGIIVIDANYEPRFPIVWRIDVVVKYDDLVFIAGERYNN